MGRNAVAARTKMDEVVLKYDQLDERAASLIMEAIEGDTTPAQVKQDVMNMLDGLDDPTKLRIMLKAVSLYAASNTSNTKSRNTRSTSGNDDEPSIFGRKRRNNW